MSQDPLFRSYPALTPYQFASNTPIYAIDLDGLEMLQGYLDYTNKMGVSLLKKVDATQKRADALQRTHKIIHKQEPSILDKAGYYFEATMHNFGEFSDAEDVSVLTQGKTVRGEDATLTDYTFAGAGFFVPFVSGATVKQTLKGLGGEILEKFADKVKNQADHLTDLDIIGAVRDIHNNPVVINGKTYQHLKEVEEALDGLGRELNQLNKKIDDGRLTDEVLKEAKRLRTSV